MKFDLELQKETAKIGMIATLGATVVTSMFMKNKSSCSFWCFILWFCCLASYALSTKKIKINHLRIIKF